MKFIAILFLIFLYCASCYTPRYVYSPPTQNIPDLSQKNDAELAASYGSSIDLFRSGSSASKGFDLHAAWALSKHFAFMLNENLRWEKNQSNDSFFPNDSSFLSYNRSFTEFGAGYFTALRNNDKMQFQVFGGAALGTSKISDNFYSNSIVSKKYHRSGITKLFVQPSFIFRPGNNFSAAFSSRVTEVIFSNTRTNYTSEELNNYLLDSLTVNPVFFWEPALTYTFGLKNFPLKFRIQGSISVLLNHRFVESRSSNISLGIVSNFFGNKQMKKPASKK